MEAKRRRVISIRNTMVFVLLVELVVIWVHEPQAFAVLLVALVIATKLLEIKQGTRRIPYGPRDSVSEQLAVYRYLEQREFRPGVWALDPRDSTQSKEDWRDAERHLLDAAKAKCTHFFMEEASRQMKLLEQTSLRRFPAHPR